MRNKKTGSSIRAIAVIFFLITAMFYAEAKGMTRIPLSQAALAERPKEALSSGPFLFNEWQERVLFENKDGEIIHLASLKGKVVFINFWATWCLPCIVEMPTIQKLYSNFAENKDVVFLMVDVDNNREKSQKFMDRKKFNLPVYTPVSAIPPEYMDGAIPTTLVLNKYGRVVFKHEGMGDFSDAEFKSFIELLIEE